MFQFHHYFLLYKSIDSLNDIIHDHFAPFFSFSHFTRTFDRLMIISAFKRIHFSREPFCQSFCELSEEGENLFVEFAMKLFRVLVCIPVNIMTSIRGYHFPQSPHNYGKRGEGICGSRSNGLVAG